PAPVSATPVSTAPAEADAAREPASVAEPHVPAAAAPPTPASVATTPGASLDTALAAAGLVWVNTDTDKLRAAQAAAAQIVQPVRVPRERKPLPPVDATPMQQVETTHR
ncbi:ribonuclease E, partial [Burkholderia pseudomallei]